MTDLDVAVRAFISRVRTCPDTCPACRAEAAALLGEPVDRCPACGFATLPGERCPCERFIGEPGNPAARHFHELSRDVA